jgi:hypothetical protein
MASLSREDVLSVVGPADETLITEIIATEATLEELTQACPWVNNDEALSNDGRPLPSGRTADLVELLTPHDDEDESAMRRTYTVQPLQRLHDRMK